MKKTLFFFLTTFMFCNGLQAQAAVIDPSNLAQNIMQVIQSKIESKITGDAKEIADSQLKTESQSTADIVGMNNSVKTALNLGMAEFNYENAPSSLYKTYYQNLDIRAKNYTILSHLQRVKAYYQSAVLSIISPVRNDAYIKRFNALAEAVNETDLLYAQFTNTVDKGSGTATSLADTQGSYNSTTQLSSSLGASLDTKAMEKAFNQQMNAINQQIADVEKAKAKIDGDDNIPDDIKKSMLGDLNAQSLDFSDQLNELASNFQSSVTSTISGALGLDGALGGLFGSNASEKGKGQNIQVNAPMGRMPDAQRIEFATKSFKNLDVIGYQVTALENELKAIKADYDLKKYVDESKFSTSGFYENSGAMDYTKMMNFDTE